YEIHERLVGSERCIRDTLFTPLIQNTGIVILQARNQLKFRSLLYLAISIVSLGGQILLAKKMGAIGCAIAIGTSLMIGQGLIMNAFYYRKQNINILQFWKEILKMLIPPSLVTVAALTILLPLQIDNFITLALAIAVFTCIYIPVIWRFSINQYERNLLLTPISRLWKRIRLGEI
ncbi:MAG: polysaccharide biosynthesis C-terminal domain-containing protein, partial [Muribaculaceae bacterium]|nr:polysaccharide biosynthesis C-terminal domain-containing protein [Muribaculaceae bacterium]